MGMAGRHVIAGMSKARLSMPPGLKIGEVKGFDARFDDFWAVQEKIYEIAVTRDSEYLNWRYVAGPTPYKVFCVEKEENGKIKGFIVLSCYDEEVRRGRIVDLLVEVDNEQITNLLLTEAINYFIDEKVDVITCWMLEQWPAFDSLKKKGFKRRETNHDLMVRSYTTGLGKEYVADSSRWYMTMGDSDYF